LDLQIELWRHLERMGLQGRNLIEHGLVDLNLPAGLRRCLLPLAIGLHVRHRHGYRDFGVRVPREQVVRGLNEIGVELLRLQELQVGELLRTKRAAGAYRPENK
jgi:hypothetical protein